VAPDGSRLASADDTGEVRVWDPATGSLHHILTGHPHRVTALALAPDGSWLASGDTSARPWRMPADSLGQVHIWDLATGATRHILTGHIGMVSALLVAPDGSWLVSVNVRGQVHIWNPTTGTLLRRFTGHTLRLSAVAMAPDGSWLASAGQGMQIEAHDPATATTPILVQRKTLQSLADGPDWPGSINSANYRHQILIRDVDTGTVRHTLISRTGWVRTLAVAPDGSWLASADNGGLIQIWDMDTGTIRHILTGHTGSVRALVVAPNGSWLASAGNDGQIRIWNTVTANVLTSLRVAAPLSYLALTPTTIAAAGEHGPYFLTLIRKNNDEQADTTGAGPRTHNDI
ncbi:MAG: WD40 repeat domain-containing protein, partial [Pseudonocardiales bacterium]|nr:WD40 repeat domain-containing protein [Pseudonocardiales bacterium]